MIVKFRDEGARRSTNPQAMAHRLLQNKQRIEVLGGRVIHNLGLINAVAADLSAAQVQALKSDARVAFVEADPVREPFQPMAVRSVTPQAETVPYGIPMVQADQVSDEHIANRKICIMDTGYDGTHPDLRQAPGGNIAGNNDTGLGNNTGDWFHDGYGHGTHVAGTISALGGNDTGVVGVTGSDTVGLHIVKVFDDGGNWAYGSDLVVAIEQCVNAGANVISMSLGGSFSSVAEQQAFDEAYASGVLSIAAAGNGGNSFDSYPASYDSVVSVAALDENKIKAGFSQFNAQVELAAPGVAVLSTVPGNAYEAWDGTSMATPHVSAVAALVWSHFPSCTPSAIRHALGVSAEDLGTEGRDVNFGFGLVQAKAAVEFLAANGCVEPPPPPPPPPVEELLKGVVRSGLSGAQGSEQTFVINVPADAANLTVNLAGGFGDADLYVRFGAEPTLTQWDCRPFSNGNFETCSFPTPSEGQYFVKLVGFTSYSDTTVVADWSSAACLPQSLSASGLPLAIPDNSITGVRATIPVTREGTVADLWVSAGTIHTYSGDLVVSLVAPSGKVIPLSVRQGGPTDNLWVSKQVPEAIGEAVNGDWQLLVQDRARGDKGQLTSFDLSITPSCN